MSGHSHWAGIKHKKALVDAKKGRLFSRLARNITTAARVGGGNPDTNLTLKYAIEKARDANVGKESITRAIQKGAGGLDGAEALVELVYEGYGPGGVAIMVEVVTDNRNRTAPDIRKIFDLRGGSLGSSGCVNWMFRKKGLIRIPQVGVDEDELMTVVVEADAEDMQAVGDYYEVTCAPGDLEAVKQALEAAKFNLETVEVTQLPKSTVTVSGGDSRKLLKLLDALEEQEDVQNVYANFDIPEEELVQMESS